VERLIQIKLAAGKCANLAAMDPQHPFEQLRQAAAAQPEPQRLLFVFAAAELPPDASPEQRRRFEASEGGALAPVTCVDKGLEDLGTFDELVAEARYTTPHWQVVFIAGLPGQGGKPPSPQQVDGALQAMVDNVKIGRFGAFLALNPAGEMLRFS
jgi:hypothetical protein